MSFCHALGSECPRAHRKSPGRTAISQGRGNSEACAVPKKLPNRAVGKPSAAAVVVEGRRAAQGNAIAARVSLRTIRSHDAGTALDGIRQTAKRRRDARFTGLPHYLYRLLCGFPAVCWLPIQRTEPPEKAGQVASGHSTKLSEPAFEATVIRVHVLHLPSAADADIGRETFCRSCSLRPSLKTELVADQRVELAGSRHGSPFNPSYCSMRSMGIASAPPITRRARRKFLNPSIGRTILLIARSDVDRSRQWPSSPAVIERGATR